MFGVPGFLGVKRRSRLPVALDVTFTIDSSGSMGAIWNFARSPETIEELNKALTARGIGTQGDKINRFSLLLNSTGAAGPGANPHYEQRMLGLVDRPQRWLPGNTTAFAAWGASSNYTVPIGKGTEDLLGQIWWIASNYASRAGDFGGEGARIDPAIEQIIVMASNEQDGVTLTEETGARTALNSPAPLKRIVALATYDIVVNPVHTPAATAGAWTPFGVIFNNRTQYFVVYINLPQLALGYNGVPSTYYRTVQNVPAADVVFNTANINAGVTPHTTAGGLIYTLSLEQKVNMVALANATGSAYLNTGAVYTITPTFNTIDPQPILDVFGASLGDALGGLIYGLNS